MIASAGKCSLFDPDANQMFDKSDQSFETREKKVIFLFLAQRTAKCINSAEDQEETWRQLKGILRVNFRRSPRHFADGKQGLLCPRPTTCVLGCRCWVTLRREGLDINCG